MYPPHRHPRMDQSTDAFSMLLFRFVGDQQLYSDNMLQKIPLEFLRQHSKCCNYFKTLQTKTINRNLELFNRFPPEDNEKLNYLKTRFAETFVTKYEIWPIKAYQKLMPRVSIDLSLWIDFKKMVN